MLLTTFNVQIIIMGAMPVRSTGTHLTRPQALFWIISGTIDITEQNRGGVVTTSEYKERKIKIWFSIQAIVNGL